MPKQYQYHGAVTHSDARQQEEMPIVSDRTRNDLQR